MTMLTRAGVATACAVGVVAGAAANADGPILSPAFFLPGDLAVGAAVESQSTPDIARGGQQFLLVWSDSRSNPTGWPDTSDQTGPDLMAARVAGNGAVIDVFPLAVDISFGAQSKPLVAWNGSNWLVVWESQLPTPSYYQYAIEAARVSPDGIVLDQVPLTLSASSAGNIIALASNGNEWLVAAQGWQAGDGGLEGWRIASDGTVVNGSPVVLLPAMSYLYFDVDINVANGEYLISYLDGSNMKARRFSSTLAPIGAAFAIPGSKLTSNGQQYFITWTSGLNVVCSPMSASGTLTFPSGRVLATASSITYPGATEVAWDGTNWWAAWENASTGHRVARIAPTGTVLDPGGVSLGYSPPTQTDQLRIEGGVSGGLQLAWQDMRAGGTDPYDIYTGHVSSEALPLGQALVSTSAASQQAADIARGPQGTWMVAWRGRYSGGSSIMTQRLNRSGSSIDPEPTMLATGPTMENPAIAWDGERYLVVWGDNNVIKGRRVDAEGVPIDSAPFTIMPGISAEIAALDGVFLVVGTHAPINWQYRFTFCRRVEGATAALLDPAPVALGGSFAMAPAVCTFGGRWLAVWEQHVSHDSPYAAAMAAFIEPSGVPSTAWTITFNGYLPAIAASDNVALVVYDIIPPANYDNTLAARRILPDGSMTASFTVADAPSRQINPALAWTGGQFVATWEDRRNQLAFFDNRTDVYGARITEGGAVADPSGFVVVADSLPAIAPAVAGGDGSALIANSYLVWGAPYAAYRLRLTLVDPPLTGDLDGDGLVGGADLGMLIAAWGTANLNGDLDGDGVVTAFDLAILLASWS